MLTTVQLRPTSASVIRQRLLARTREENRLETMLDRALEDSFPASDPTASNTFN